MPKISIIDLPDIVLLEIFTYISNIREKLRLRIVCSRFNKIAKEAVKNQPYRLHFKSDYLFPNENLKISLFKLTKMAPKCISVIDFGFSNLIWSHYKKLHLSFLQNLHIFSPKAKLSTSLTKWARNLQHLSITLVNIKDLSLPELNLKSLCIHAPMLKLSHVSTWLEKFGKSLNTLSLKRLDGPISNHFRLHTREHSLDIIFKCCPNLSYLILFDIASYPLKEKISLPKLTYFDFRTRDDYSEYSDLNESIYSSVVRRAPNLQYIIFPRHALSIDLLYSFKEKFCPSLYVDLSSMEYPFMLENKDFMFFIQDKIKT